MKKMKKMKKQFLSLFVLLCMIISMFPTTALAANIDVSGKVTVDRVYEEPKCADNLYYGEVNVNGSATESKTRLTHPVLPLIQWQYGNNTYQIIPSAYKYYVYNINATISLRGLKAVKDQARFRAGRERINVIRRW